MASVNFKCSDGVKLTVLKEILTPSLFVQRALEECKDGEIELPAISRNLLVKIVTFLTRLQIDPLPQIPKPIGSTDLAKYVPLWYSTFVSMDPPYVIELFRGAHEMEIPQLMDLLAAKLASMVKGKSLEQIDGVFNAPEEEQMAI